MNVKRREKANRIFVYRVSEKYGGYRIPKKIEYSTL